MNRDFDILVKEHLQEILCEAEKNHALSLIKTTSFTHHKRVQLQLFRQRLVIEIQLQDCIISPSLSPNRI